jgi:hypothetical protein
MPYCSQDDYEYGPFVMFSWVHVPNPFNLMEFSRRLLLDFQSDDLRLKETAAIGIMQGQDPIQECRKILSKHKYLIVIHGLRSSQDWDSIQAAFFSNRMSGNFVVTTDKKTVAKHCASGQDVNIRGLEVDEALNLFTKVRTWIYQSTKCPFLYAQQYIGK